MLYKTFVLLLFIYLTTGKMVVCRSLDSEVDESNMEDTEYDADAEDAETDDANQEDESNAKVAESPEEIDPGLHNGRVLDFRSNTYLQREAEDRSARANRDQSFSENRKYQNRDILEEKIDDSLDTSLNQPTKRGMFNKYMNKLSSIKDSHKTTAHDNNLMKTDENAMGNSRAGDTKKSSLQDTYTDNYEIEKKSKVSHRKDYDNINEENRSPYRNAREDIRDTSNEDNYNRDRRDVINKGEDGAKSDSSSSEDEEAIIKKHLKRLSDVELNDLLKSLSDSKRELLKKIIDNNSAETNINKRDITKKAGAVEDNNLNENSLSDSCKIESETSKDTSQSTTVEKVVDKKDTSKQEEDETQGSSMDDQQTTTTPGQMSSDSYPDTEKTTSLSKKKRDAYYDSAELDKDTLQKENEDYCPEAEDYSSLNDYESELHDNNNNKREALDDTMKGLEDSFPNINTYENNGLDMAPLIRVKRTDNLARKRAAALAPDDKVSYCPFKSENVDEDNDEGNEFEDQGFYDRALNLSGEKKDPNEKIGLSLGSDSDNFLSNVIGDDNNLKINSEIRLRRSLKHGMDDLVDRNNINVQPDYEKSS